MSLLQIVQAATAEIVRAEERIDGVQLTTACMYPTNAFVSVVVRGGVNNFSVSDEGKAFREVENSVSSVRISEGMVKHIISAQGLHLSNGVISSPNISREALPIAIALVANASKETADWFYNHLKLKRARNFRQMVRKFLEERFAKQVRHDEIIIGKSNKPHKFDNIIPLPNGGRFIVDPVLNEHASISARIVANIDIAQMGYENLEQRIIYDDEEDWHAEDLNLLVVGAPTIAFSQASDAVKRIAAVR